MKIQFKVPSMNDSSECGQAITRAVAGVDPDASVAADPESKLVKVETGESSNTSEEALKKAVEAAGYPVE
ncbi:heavy-metal-associated domain-containing protein [Romeria aff. gracilis LEGE 07310]|uniref:Heavy-metal-associated domain-containing protein n=1 Tax=Vasconcelosia minhoensis LEGE 07310 TaxID=915328 RepID=A0A8J7DDD0_9CYAN|nr:heavy-metal-associated domain-containing protein [Romeria gracilis]MBE9078638.1 heavy-metal-associated domain-containing protein [Romeria aff. gracilis LEGE 07310]